MCKQSINGKRTAIRKGQLLDTQVGYRSQVDRVPAAEIEDGVSAHIVETRCYVCSTDAGAEGKGINLTVVKKIAEHIHLRLSTVDNGIGAITAVVYIDVGSCTST